MANTKRPAVTLTALQSLNLGRLVSQLNAIHAPAFAPCDDPICDMYGCPGPNRTETTKAQLAAAVALAQAGVTPELVRTLVIARTSARWAHFSGFDYVMSDLFPNVC